MLLPHLCGVLTTLKSRVSLLILIGSQFHPLIHTPSSFWHPYFWHETTSSKISPPSPQRAVLASGCDRSVGEAIQSCLPRGMPPGRLGGGRCVQKLKRYLGTSEINPPEAH